MTALQQKKRNKSNHEIAAKYTSISPRSLKKCAERHPTGRITSKQGGRMGNKVSSWVDWDKVPVVMTGTPNPEAIRLIVESIREFEIRELMTSQRPVGTNEHVTACAPNRGGLQT